MKRLVALSSLKTLPNTVPLCAALIILQLAVPLTLCAAGKSIWTLETRDTSLGFEEASTGPRLTELRTADKTVWANRAIEKLIESAEVQGKRIPLRWIRNHEAIREGAGRFALVYENLSPKLRLTWEWEARASYGPIEHRIRVSGLD